MRYSWVALWLLTVPVFGQTIGPAPGGGVGTVTSLANPSIFGVTCSVASATTVPAITCTAGTPALGTPSAIVLTNATGTAAGLTAGTVTTNANLTGDVTSVGNAATLAAGSASALNSGTLAAARGGAGATNGALKANGSGLVSQAACADLSNAGALCPVTPGTGVATAAAANLSAAGGLSTTVAIGTSALGTGAITSATCATVVTTSATNTATTDVIWWGFNGDPTGVTGYAPATAGMLTIIAYPSANNVNFKVCNNTLNSITPGAITLNWRVIR